MENLELDKLFEDFLMEKEYVCGLSKLTLKGYRVMWRTFKRIIKDPTVSRETFLCFTRELITQGMQSKTVNTYISGLNSSLTWLRENGENSDNIRIKKIKEDKKIQPSYTNEELIKMLRWKPQTWPQERLKMMILTLVDTGCRIDELITLERRNVDFQNMFIKVTGKGSKERIIPMSVVLRKHLFPYAKHPYSLFFPSRTGQLLDYDNCLGDLKTTCFKLQIPCKGFHGFRRSFARGFIKNGGDVFSLQLLLGHTDLSTTRLYVSLNHEELKEIHLKNSILSRLK